MRLFSSQLLQNEYMFQKPPELCNENAMNLKPTS